MHSTFHVNDIRCSWLRKNTSIYNTYHKSLYREKTDWFLEILSLSNFQHLNNSYFTNESYFFWSFREEYFDADQPSLQDIWHLGVVMMLLVGMRVYTVGVFTLRWKKSWKQFLVEQIFVVGNVKYNGVIMRAIWVNTITLWLVGMSSRVLMLFITRRMKII